MMRALFLYRPWFFMAVLLGGCHMANPLAAPVLAPLEPAANREGDVPELSVTQYFGYASAGTEAPLAVYLWLPMSTPELSVRMITPALGPRHMHRVRALTEPDYLAHAGEKTYFDPALSIARCPEVVLPSQVAEPCGQWVFLAENTDSPEAGRSPDGLWHNSAVRLTPHPSAPERSLDRGLYRLWVRPERGTVLRGTFTLEIGAPILLDGLVMARSLPGLARQLAQVSELPEARDAGGPHGTVPYLKPAGQSPRPEGHAP